MNDSIITLSPEIANRFLLFQKYYDIFCLMEAHGAFHVEHGKVTLNFANGVLQNIVKESLVYKR